MSPIQGEGTFTRTTVSVSLNSRSSEHPQEISPWVFWGPVGFVYLKPTLEPVLRQESPHRGPDPGME